MVEQTPPKPSTTGSIADSIETVGAVGGLVPEVGAVVQLPATVLAAATRAVGGDLGGAGTTLATGLLASGADLLPGAGDVVNGATLVGKAGKAAKVVKTVI